MVSNMTGRASAAIVFKKYITVDNCSKLLYTVCDGGDHMTIIINNSSQVPIYEQISRRVKELIASGELIEGAPLPSVRMLAKELKISALTVKKAYDSLEQEGFVTTVHGKGSFVAGNRAANAARRRELEGKLRELESYENQLTSASLRLEEVKQRAKQLENH